MQFSFTAYADSPTITEFPSQLSSNAQPTQIIYADGYYWFTEQGADKIGRMSISGQFTEYPLPSNIDYSNADPYGITLGPDGNIWFTESNSFANQIGMFNPSNPSDITEYPIPTGGAEPKDITTGPDGNIWFTEYNTDKVGTFSTSDPSDITEYGSAQGISPDSGPFGITSADNYIWVTEYDSGSIAQINPSNGHTTEVSVPSGGSSNPLGITKGPDGNIWFTEQTGNNIGEFDPNTPSSIIEYNTNLTSNSEPYYITPGNNNDLWFTEKESNKIAEITTSGIITEYNLSSSASPEGITTDNTGNIWFTEYGLSNTIGELLDPIISSTPGSGSSGSSNSTNSSIRKVPKSPDTGLVSSETNTLIAPTIALIASILIYLIAKKFKQIQVN